MYLSAIIDGFNNEVISVVLSEHPDLKLAYDTVNLALKHQDIEEVILHSDQGSLVRQEVAQYIAVRLPYPFRVILS